jgi:hypothetical protein
MRGLLIKNKSEKVSVAAYNYYGASFKLNVFDQDTNTYISQDLDMVEGMEPIASYDCACTEARTTGQEVIAVDDASGLSPNERISVGNFIYRIASIDGNNITLHTGLREDLDGTETVSRVGNMGVYSLDLSVSANGTFLVQAKDTVFGLMHTDSITVANKSVEEMFDDVNTNIDENETLLTTSKQGWKVLI